MVLIHNSIVKTKKGNGQKFAKVIKGIMQYNMQMVLVWIGIAIGVLIAIILIVKVMKTPSMDVLRMDTYCKKCGLKTNGLKCPRCEKKASSSFGV